MEKKEYSIEVGGKTLTAEFNNWADQANGSVLLRYGNTAVLATAVMGSITDRDYFPLSVEYEEKFYAAGAILGSQFVRREGRPSEEAILSARVVDRTIRPLFDQHTRREIQVIISVLSIDEDDADVVAVNAASLALATSDIPWRGPVAAVRIGQALAEQAKDAEGGLVINPTYEARKEENEVFDVLACGRDGLINMIEVGANEVPEETLVSALEQAQAENAKLQAWQEQIVAEIGKEKALLPKPEVPAELADVFAETITPKMEELIMDKGKNGITELKSEWMIVASERLPDVPTGQAEQYFEEQTDEFVHEKALTENTRVDGRAFDEIRPLFAQAGGVSNIIHGTGLFYRGQTHVFSALTLGGPGDAQLLDTIESQDVRKRFLHHYNFPPFSVGETGRVGGFNRRQIGHGALAEKALRPLIPGTNTFPYTIRIVSECMASNGSTSMASVCASTLALMDAGVPIARPVAGIAMGLMSKGDPRSDDFKYKVLTDIQGPEDHHGDMDFKVAGTSEGVTAIQMDVKVGGIPLKALAEGLAQAKKARLEIIDVITSAIPEPRADINPRAPKIVTLKVKVDQIGMVIGPGGKTINGIKERTGVEEITIEDDGTVFITGKNGAAEAAAKEIEMLTHEYTAGESFEGEVTKIMDFGAFVRIAPNTEGLVHISEIAPFRIDNIGKVLSEGERVPVIIKEIDEKDRINLSIKQLDPDFAKRKGIEPQDNQHGRGQEQRPK